MGQYERRKGNQRRGETNKEKVSREERGARRERRGQRTINNEGLWGRSHQARTRGAADMKERRGEKQKRRETWGGGRLVTDVG